MSRMTALLIALAACAQAPAAEYFVSPAGSDAHPGTRAKPFASLAAARDAIRKSGRAGKEPITIHLADGMHLLGETLVLDSRDSGSANAAITYAAEHEGRATISGGVKLEGLTWQEAGKGIYKAKLPAELVKDCAFDELWLETSRPGEPLGRRGIKLDMARYPNRTDAQVFDGVTDLKTLTERARKYAHPETGYVHAIQGNGWGSVHFRLKGVNAKGLELEGGWQQNRSRRLSSRRVMVENVFEELDTPGEWFFDRKAGTLYVMPSEGLDLDGATLLATDLRELIRFDGSTDKPVRHVAIRGVQFCHARRIFMEEEKAWEPLVRGDWSIVRSAAVLMTGTEDCAIRDCYFNAVGGNGVFFNNYNRRSAVVDCRFERLGESAVCFVGNYACTRSNPIGYANSFPQSETDLTPGPKGEDFPKDCEMSGCLVFAIGRVGKQTAGAFISMSQDIAVRHNTIYHVPRSGITVNDGCWGGHVIEDNDVFDTVIETGDHGPFNSWGRDRYWDTRHHGSKPYGQDISTAGDEKTPQRVSRERARLDTVRPTVIRRNRFMHRWSSHSWGIDLDDGSSNYHVLDNLCLGCTVKLREGFFRRVENNIFIGRAGIQIHVPFDRSGDSICRNIVVTANPMTLPWRNDVRKIAGAGRIDDNLYWSTKQQADPNVPNEALAKHQKAGIDANSVSADPRFVDPAGYDFRVAEDSPARKLGFKNFAMTGFGVTKPALKAVAVGGHRTYQKFRLSDVFARGAQTDSSGGADGEKLYTILGAKVSDLDTEEEKSIAGVGKLAGVYVVEAPAGSAAAKAGIRAGDAILAVDGKEVANYKALAAALARAQGKAVKLRVVGATDRTVTVRGK